MREERNSQQFSNVMLGLSTGLAMLKLTDPAKIASSLLATTLRSDSRDQVKPAARELLSGPECR